MNRCDDTGLKGSVGSTASLDSSAVDSHSSRGSRGSSSFDFALLVLTGHLSSQYISLNSTVWVVA